MRLTEHPWESWKLTALNLPSPPKLIGASVLLDQLLRTIPHSYAARKCMGSKDWML